MVLKPCPFCGKEMDHKDPETLHPTGVGWKMRAGGFRSYESFKNVPKEQWCWGVFCDTTIGGCGAHISGDSEKEAINSWNKRV